MSFSPDKSHRTLTNPNPQEYGYFGYSVSTNGKLVAVGAFGEKADGNTSAGHAYVFNATSGALITKLSSPNPQINGWFGFSISMSGKLVTVGAPFEMVDENTQAGNAYIFYNV